MAPGDVRAQTMLPREDVMFGCWCSVGVMSDETNGRAGCFYRRSVPESLWVTRARWTRMGCAIF